MDLDIDGPQLYQERSKEIFDYSLETESESRTSYRERYAGHLLDG